MPEAFLRSTRAEIALLAVGSILVVGQMYVVIPLFAQMGAAFGRPAADLVATSSAFGIPYALAGLVAGPMADAWGAKTVIMASLIATALTTFAVGVAPGFAGLTVLRALQGWTAGLFSAPVFAYIARNLAEDVRAFANTAVMAAAMSSIVLMQLLPQFAAAMFGWRDVFFVLAPTFLLLAVAANGVLVRSSASSRYHVFRALSALPRLLRQWRLLALYIATLTLLGGFVAVWSGLALYGPKDLRANPTYLFLLRASALPVMVTVPFLALRLRRFSLPARIVSGLGLSALSLAATAHGARHIPTLAVDLAVCVAGILIAAPAVVQGVVKAAADASGAAVSLYTFAIFLGASLGPQFAVSLAPTGIGGLLLATAVLLMVGAVFGAVGAACPKTGG